MMEDVQEPTSKTIFVTKDTYTGALGGFLGADAKCQAEADSPGSRAKGTYRARLGHFKSGLLPGDRWFARYDLPYMLVDGSTKVADNYSDLTDGSLDHEINMTPDGTVYTGFFDVWSDYTALGVRDVNKDCVSWYSGTAVGGIGRGSLTNERWAFDTTVDCAIMNRIYCIEQ